MAKHNTHRAPGRTTGPVTSVRRAARSAGGAAVLGTVLFGSAMGIGASAADAAPTPAPAAPVTSPSTTTVAPATPAPARVLDTSRTLRWGSSGGSVSDLQSALNDRGAGLAVDGKFGPKTHAAVKDYQRDKGLAVDGIVGPKTRGALNGTGTSGGSGSSNSSSNSSGIVSTARGLIGTGYSWGGNSPSSGFDCSGFVNYVYAQHGISLPRTSGAIAAGGRWISQSEARAGDIVVWSGHVGIYAGNGTVIDASGSKRQIVERGIWGSPQGFVTYR